MGVDTWQHPLDVWVTQEIIYATEPDWVIETGTRKGGSALIWASILRGLGSNSKVITIDIKPIVEKAASYNIWKESIHLVTGDSIGDKTLSKVRSILGGNRNAIVILDSNHECDHVLNELRLYGDLIRIGSYVIVQDMQFDKAMGGYGPSCGVNKFLEENKNFKRSDLSNRFLSSNIKGGVLEKVRDD